MKKSIKSEINYKRNRMLGVLKNGERIYKLYDILSIDKDKLRKMCRNGDLHIK